MLVLFRSKAAADVMMYEHHAKRILDMLGKDAKRGILTNAELPQAIRKLEAEIAESKLHSVSEEVQHDIDAHQGEDHDHERPEMVTFATRAYPLLEMMRAARDNGNDVVWGV